jgi:hypothetical protein
MTCAACHNAQLTYQGKKIRIDGGFNHTFDFMSYMFALDDAMQATLTDASKFDRLAARVGATAPDAKVALRKRFESDAERVHTYRTVTMATPVVWGPGRIDAFNLITNRMLATETGIAENWSSPMAPVKPPFVWNAPAGLVDAVVGHRAGPDRSQPWRNAGRLSARWTFAPRRRKTASSSRCHARQSQQDRAFDWIAWRLRNGPRTCLGKIDRQKAESRARRCS